VLVLTASRRITGVGGTFVREVRQTVIAMGSMAVFLQRISNEHVFLLICYLATLAV
jgi:hypothetical protein